MPDTFTVIPLATFADANVPTADPVLKVTVSPLITPTSAGEEYESVAVLFWSYTLLAADTPVMVRGFCVMFAEAEGCVTA